MKQEENQSAGCFRVWKMLHDTDRHKKKEIE